MTQLDRLKNLVAGLTSLHAGNKTKYGATRKVRITHILTAHGANVHIPILPNRHALREKTGGQLDHIRLVYRRTGSR